MRVLPDQKPDFGRLSGQLEDGEVLIARFEGERSPTPNGGSRLDTPERFRAFMQIARGQGMRPVFYAVPRRELRSSSPASKGASGRHNGRR